MSEERTLRGIVCDYILSRELGQGTIDNYHRAVGYLCSFYGGDVPEQEFTAELVSRFLLQKQEQGCSSYYRQSLRNSLVALLNFCGKTGRVRSIRLEEIEVEAWTPEEVTRLIEATEKLRVRRPYWRTIIPGAYYSGLTQIDLHRVEREWIDASGILRTRRSKTRKRVIAQLPLWLVDQLPKTGLCWPWETTDENFRLTFSRIVRWAGLTGSFKKLRKTAGTQVEKMYPGTGHLLLANGRKIFERHYLDMNQTIPVAPPPLPDPPPRAA